MEKELMVHYCSMYTGGCPMPEDETSEGIISYVKEIFDIDDISTHEHFVELMTNYFDSQSKKAKKKINYDKKKNDEIKKLKQQNKQLKQLIDDQHEELKQIKIKVDKMIM